MTITEKISEFKGKALTRLSTLQTEFNAAFDRNNFLDPTALDLQQKSTETLSFLEVLNSSDYGQMTERQISDVIDFFVQWINLSDSASSEFFNYSINVSEGSISGEFATTQQLAAEALARQSADSTLDSRISYLEDNQIDPSGLFPEGFFDNYNSSYVVVFDDDNRLHSHSNKDDLDEINSDDISRIKALEAHFASIGNPGGQHVSQQDRDRWESNISSSLKTSITKSSHGLAVGENVTINTSGVFVKITDPANEQWIGIITQVVNANSFVITTDGLVVGLSGLTPGSDYYVQSTGVLGTTETEIKVLKAYTSTSGFITKSSSASVSPPVDNSLNGKLNLKL